MQTDLEQLLTDGEKKRLLELSRETLVAAFSSDANAPLDKFTSDPQNLTEGLSEMFPCFVTLTKTNGRLRGCIGSLVSFNPLYKNVFHMTRQAAFEDPRFRAMTLDEVPDTIIHIAVLGPKKKLEKLDDLVIGKHGLHVSHGHKRGVLLASVAVDNEFSRERFLAETCQKAGLDPLEVEKYEVSYFDEVSFGE